MIVAMTNSDEVNVVACQIAWTLYGTRTKIARIRSREFTNRRELLVSTDDGAAMPPGTGPRGFAVDMFISPEELVTTYIERLIRYPGALQVLDFANGQVRLVGLRALKGGLLVGQELRNLREHLPNVDSRVIAIFRNGRSVKPEGDAVVESGDEVFFLAATKDIRRVMSEMRRLEDPARSVVIAGGGNIGLRLAQELEGENQVKLIERDPARARRISEQLRNAIVLSGDAADEELLVEENIDSADTFVALTNSEEANILSAMLAKRLGCAEGHGADHQARLRGADGERSDRHRDLAADDHDRLAARVCAARRHRARALAAARRRRGDGGDRARQPRRSGRRPPRRGDSAAGRRDHRRDRARRGRDHGAPRHDRAGERPRDPVPERPAADRGDRPPVPELTSPR